MALSPLNQRRWRIFIAQKKAVVSAVILIVTIFFSLFAELLCNQRPIVASYQGRLYFPVLVSYPETTFGGDFDSEADYTDEFIIEKLTTGGNWALFPPVRFDYREVDLDLNAPAPSPPEAKHWLGTDDRGRDVVARLVYGFRLSIIFGFTLAFFGSLLGVIIGGVQGFIGGRFDLFCQRLTELWSSQNELYLLIILSSLFDPSVTLIFILLSLFGWMGLSSYVRAEFLRAREYEFVQSAIALGSKRLRVMWVHILPNTLTPVITFMPFRISAGITGLTALDFLSLGVPPPTPSLGELLSQGKNNIESWWILMSVFAVLVLTITMLNFIGEAIQKAMDPKS